jgi:hypothetical protein
MAPHLRRQYHSHCHGTLKSHNYSLFDHIFRPVVYCRVSCFMYNHFLFENCQVAGTPSSLFLTEISPVLQDSLKSSTSSPLFLLQALVKSDSLTESCMGLISFHEMSTKTNTVITHRTGKLVSYLSLYCIRKHSLHTAEEKLFLFN